MQGGIVVQDCLHLLSSLLHANAANQLMFRELGYLAQLPGLLVPEPPEGPPGVPQSMSAEKAANLTAALQTVNLLLLPLPEQRSSPAAAGGHANEAVLLQHGLLSALLDRAVGADSTPDAGVRAQALLCLAAVAAGSQATRDMLAGTVVNVSASTTLPIMHAVLRAVIAGDSDAEAAAAEELIAAQCSGNPAAQAALASTIAPGAVHAFGGELLQGLLRHGGREELLASSRASLALAQLLASNAEVKQRVLGVQLPPQQQQQQAGSVMAACAQRLAASVTAHGARPEGAQLVANFTLLMLRWLHNCPVAVGAFLASVSQTPFLVGAVMSDGQFGEGSDVIRGMSALLLGVCAKYAPTGAAISQATLASAITGQIGVGRFLAAVDGVLAYAAASAAGNAARGVHFGSSSMATLSELAAEVRQQLAQMQAQGGAQAPHAPPRPSASGGTSADARRPAPPSQQSVKPPPPASFGTVGSGAAGGDGLRPPPTHYGAAPAAAAPPETAPPSAAATSAGNAMHLQRCGKLRPCCILCIVWRCIA
jgi:hypothetical protein